MVIALEAVQLQKKFCMLSKSWLEKLWSICKFFTLSLITYAFAGIVGNAAYDFFQGTFGSTSVIIVAIIVAIIAVISSIAFVKANFRKSKKIKKNYPKLSIVGIIRERKVNQKFQTIYLLMIATIIYAFASKFLAFVVSNIFLCILLGSVLLITLETLIFNYRINRGWYGSSESEAREIVDFIVKNSEDIDFTDGNSPKSIIKPEDIQQVVAELGIQIPGYPEPNAINKSFSEG